MPKSIDTFAQTRCSPMVNCIICIPMSVAPNQLISVLPTTLHRQIVCRREAELCSAPRQFLIVPAVHTVDFSVGGSDIIGRR
ncbi:MAG: hypothetical protein ACK4I8_09930 [Armatimonadota bacterium]